jgi:hypothetical protein
LKVLAGCIVEASVIQRNAMDENVTVRESVLTFMRTRPKDVNNEADTSKSKHLPLLMLAEDEAQNPSQSSSTGINLPVATYEAKGESVVLLSVGREAFCVLVHCTWRERWDSNDDINDDDDHDNEGRNNKRRRNTTPPQIDYQARAAQYAGWLSYAFSGDEVVDLMTAHNLSKSISNFHSIYTLGSFPSTVATRWLTVKNNLNLTYNVFEGAVFDSKHKVLEGGTVKEAITKINLVKGLTGPKHRAIAVFLGTSSTWLGNAEKIYSLVEAYRKVGASNETDVNNWLETGLPIARVGENLLEARDKKEGAVCVERGAEGWLRLWKAWAGHLLK